MSDHLNIGPVKDRLLLKPSAFSFENMQSTGFRPQYYVTVYDADMPLVDVWGDSEEDAKRLAESLVAFMRAGRVLCAWSEE